MTPEAARFIEHARAMLGRGAVMLEAGLFADAGRAAYLACFHAAQALIFEREQRVLRTHHGVQSEFQRLTRDNAGIDPGLRGFLSRAYVFKSIADYDLDSEASPTEDDSRTAIDMAQRFVDELARMAIA